jgi:hypothetical protein
MSQCAKRPTKYGSIVLKKKKAKDLITTTLGMPANPKNRVIFIRPYSTI